MRRLPITSNRRSRWVLPMPSSQSSTCSPTPAKPRQSRCTRWLCGRPRRRFVSTWAPNLSRHHPMYSRASGAIESRRASRSAAASVGPPYRQMSISAERRLVRSRDVPKTSSSSAASSTSAAERTSQSNERVPVNDWGDAQQHVKVRSDVVDLRNEPTEVASLGGWPSAWPGSPRLCPSLGPEYGSRAGKASRITGLRIE